MPASFASPLGSLWQRLAQLWPFFRPARWGIVWAVIATLIAAATEPMIPALLENLLDKGFVAGQLPIWMIPVGVIGIFGIRGIAGFVAQYMLAYIANTGMLGMRQAMFDKLNHANPRLFQQQSASTLSNTLVYEVQKGASILGNSWMTAMRDGMTVVALLAYLFYLNAPLTLIVLTLFPAIVAVIRLLSKRVYNIMRQTQMATDDLAYVIEENALAHRVIRLHNAQAMQNQRFSRLNQALRQLALKATVASSAMTPLTQMLVALALSIVIMAAFWQTQQTGSTVGEFIGFVTAMLLLVNPIKHLATVMSSLIQGTVALERGLELINLTSVEKEGDYAPTLTQGKIEWKNVSVQYNDREDWALKDISLSIKEGEVVALVGPSGSGKSTLVNLLPRFIEMQSGSIELDGMPLEQWQLHALRKQIAFVSQDVVMLNDTIAHNIALGDDVDEDRIAQALEHAYLTDWVQTLALGMHTRVGHNATELSGGQRQRLAIARALYKNAPILILDEATSALDNHSERLIQKALEHLMKNKTTLIIAHRLSTIEHADRVVVLEKGRIIEQGSHDFLLQKGGAYALLHRNTIS